MNKHSWLGLEQWLIRALFYLNAKHFECGKKHRMFSVSFCPSLGCRRLTISFTLDCTLLQMLCTLHTILLVALCQRLNWYLYIPMANISRTDEKPFKRFDLLQKMQGVEKKIIGAADLFCKNANIDVEIMNCVDRSVLCTSLTFFELQEASKKCSKFYVISLIKIVNILIAIFTWIACFLP